MDRLVSVNVFLTCIGSLIKDAEYASDQIDSRIIIEVHVGIVRIQRIKPIFPVFFDVSLVSDNECADLPVL